MSIKKGLVYVFTGDGKGKTSAGLGVAVRAVCNEMKVGIVQWYKEKEWLVSEYKLGEKLKGVEIYPMGKGFYNLPTDKATKEEHVKAGQKALKKAESLLKEVDVLVLDEINNAIKDELVGVEKVMRLIKKRGGVHLILTGRDANKQIVEIADLVTEMKKVKHPFDKGKKAVKGLDF